MNESRTDVSSTGLSIKLPPDAGSLLEDHMCGLDERWRYVKLFPRFPYVTGTPAL